jgi:hypothetical protein
LGAAGSSRVKYYFSTFKEVFEIREEKGSGIARRPQAPDVRHNLKTQD